MLLLFNEVPVSSSIISLGDTYVMLLGEAVGEDRAGQMVLDAGVGTCLCICV